MQPREYSSDSAWGFLILVVIVGAIVWWGRQDFSDAELALQPTDQKQYCQTIDRFRSAYEEVESGPIAGRTAKLNQVVLDRKQALLNLFGDIPSQQRIHLAEDDRIWVLPERDVYKQAKFENWIGSIRDITEQFGGSAARFTVQLVCNSALHSIAYHQPQTPIFDELTKLKDGDKVSVSGYLLSPHRDHNAFMEKSIFQKGAMDEPEFIVRFAEMKKI